MASRVFIGVDVGTGSVRAAAVTCSGIVRGHSTVPISVHNPSSNYYEQDSQQIWQAVGQAVQEACQKLHDGDVVAGLGFDATCSLVVLDAALQPITVNKLTAEDKWNVIMWMDHRASEETDFINAKPHSVLQYVGGKVSIEMQTPKLLWLKHNLPETWRRAGHFFDLPDFLTMKATGKLTRSLCSLVCKWTYVHDGTTQGWDKTFLTDIGLADLMQNNFAKIGADVLAPGEQCGTVSAAAAGLLGIPVGTPVATSLIDAHAGALALLAAGACLGNAGGEKALTGKLAVVSGTSSCHLICSSTRHDVPGVWGPYYSALLPGCWLAEAGQSATGSLIDHVIRSHPALDTSVPKDKLAEWVEGLLQQTAASRGLSDPTTLTRHLHVYPDHHGNRSPLADPTMTGMVCGLTLSAGEEDLALQYLATVQAIAYGSRAILERLRACGHSVSAVLLCGGLAQSQLFTQTHADVMGVDVLVPVLQQQSVVRGAAMLAAVAAPSGTAAAGGAVAAPGPDRMTAVLQQMAGTTSTTAPNSRHVRFHDKKYGVYQKMQEDQLAYRRMMTQ